MAELNEAKRRLGLSDSGHAFVPTMGALHAGHLSLITKGFDVAERVTASVFVNPKQFAPNEDFTRYPRAEEEDLRRLREAGVSLVYMPHAKTMYAEGHETIVQVGSLGRPLDGASRPAFFRGVATVVTKLFMRMTPTAAIFGEKDYQQLLIIKRIAKDLDLGVDIVGAPTVREEDGLAMSSRNRYLSPPERRIAGSLNVLMRKVCQRVAGGVAVPAALEQGRRDMMDAGLRPIDYLELRSAHDLSPSPQRTLRTEEAAEARLFAAVNLGGTRLIDNMPVLGA